MEKLEVSSQAPQLPLFLTKELERPLLRLKPRLMQTLQGLLARRMLLAANNTPLLGLHEILLSQPTTRVLGRSVKHLCLCADCRDLCTALHRTLPPLHVLPTLHALTPLHLACRVHLYI